MKLEIESTKTENPVIISLEKGNSGIAVCAKKDGIKLDLFTITEDGYIHTTTYCEKDELEEMGFRMINDNGGYRVGFRNFLTSLLF